jgi:hypothetical protein
MSNMNLLEPVTIQSDAPDPRIEHPDVPKFLQTTEYGPVGTQLIRDRQQREYEWDVVQFQFELAYVCAFLQVQLYAANLIENERDITLALDIIEDALKHNDLALLSIFPRPSVATFRRWLTRHARNPIVLKYHLMNIGLADCVTDREALVRSIAEDLIWQRLPIRAYGEAFAGWVYRAVPEINEASSERDLWRAVDRVVPRLHRFGNRYKLSLYDLRQWMCLDFARYY